MKEILDISGNIKSTRKADHILSMPRLRKFQRSKTTFKSSSKRHVCGKPSIHILSPCLVEMLDTADKVQLEVKYRLPPLCPSSRTRPRVIQVCGFLVDFISIICGFFRFVKVHF